ncbi:hypothetical protein SAMN05421776_104145 [Nocardia farcinica]|uniref:Uncharacterized protein n=1 Tax=Nocardia farcinica TaxID=37329 RepID=A0A0H5P6R8_NOCFR|nr:hypothetical protein CJ469_03508 [Nocardia farcinica]PFX07483.1 hypothetical protein CJ468_03667 [Nocardia farcinica]CRY83367.1 Uncharacterised protein [Nocardia farcinica]SIT19346.1 hypothetical protein SAMN05421776_104145 [Nocardia farcinica]
MLALALAIPNEHLADGLLRCLAHRWADHTGHRDEWAL